jgi:hypothetical protein
MERQSVKSSNIKSIGYDLSKSILEVEFLNGSIYQYSNVPQQMYDDLINAPSHGKFFAAYIRNKFKSTRVN